MGGVKLKSKISKETAEKIFEEYSSYVFKVALFFSRSTTLADDITQETFIKIFEKYSTLKSSESFKVWVYKITLNTTRNILRKHKWLDFFSNIPDKNVTDTLEKTFMISEDNADLWKKVNHLSQKSKQIILLHFYLELKLEEMASILKIPVGTCKSRLNSALNQLRKQFNDDIIKYYGGDSYEGN